MPLGELPGGPQIRSEPSFQSFFFHLYYFFQPICVGDVILRRVYLKHFLAKRHSLGITGVFL